MYLIQFPKNLSLFIEFIQLPTSQMSFYLKSIRDEEEKIILLEIILQSEKFLHVASCSTENVINWEQLLTLFYLRPFFSEYSFIFVVDSSISKNKSNVLGSSSCIKVNQFIMGWHISNYWNNNNLILHLLEWNFRCICR